MKKFLALILIALACIMQPLVAHAQETVKVGVVGEIWKEIWESVAEEAKKEGINIEIVLFTDYIQPNEALVGQSIDINSFQGLGFLENWNQANGRDIVPIAETVITPMLFFSNKIDSLEEFPQGGKLVLPNEVAVQTAALWALDLSGLIKIDPSIDREQNIELSDIVENPKDVQFIELESSQIPNTLNDVDVAWISVPFALDSGINTEDAIFADTIFIDQIPKARNFVIATVKERQDDPVLKRVVEIFQSDKTKEVIAKLTNDLFKPLWEDKN